MNQHQKVLKRRPHVDIGNVPNQNDSVADSKNKEKETETTKPEKKMDSNQNPD